MPELPEVEAAARELSRSALGRRLVEVTAPVGRQAGGIPARRFARLVKGRTVEAVARRGKWILIRLSEGTGLGIHLGMTGDLLCVAGGRPAFSRAAFALDSGETLHFVDPRRFGRLVAVERYEELLSIPAIAELGPDALLELTPARLRDGLRSARAVKTALLDQRVAAGLGNVYATDAFFRARIDPTTPAARVADSPALLRRLVAAIRWVLTRGLRRYAGTPRGPGEGLYRGSVYGLAGRPCPRCGRPLESRNVGGRATVFCGRCQRPLGSRG